ncbi:hypothetical protein Ssi03_75340 [Sphaerisporangium siamense]|uniref:Uncharacterized protein n=2 Tax=Sphaerisporangium TaxID=321315 RepID=A0A7W8Z4D4_9ACTN|nr:MULTISPECIES: hypothetical protein [Sphaerisporangium]MBB4700686.1 hypothetical protein [Sphaerisporangium siamense]MBB5627214.1 hypothetical protein [Sphaerisporangium krabiense]GII65375.1 hypothetical protein Skr01_54600 [Sphaerisporangium krabiense]GII89544.1 hypothetical protein Ssi03_75340 [Sphaerisporangium siamense]
MTAAAMQAVLTLIFGVIAVCTFMLKGRQWPTFITACLFGMFFGTTTWGRTIGAWISEFAAGIIKGLS